MKKLFVLFVSVLINASFYAHAQSSEPFTTYRFGAAVASTINAVEASSINGSITVTGANVSEAVVEMYVSPTNQNNWRPGLFASRSRQNNNWSVENIKQELDENYTIEVNVRNGTLYAVARPKNRNRHTLGISFRISVPKNVNNNLQTTNGSIQISNLSGSQNLRTTNGSLRVENVTGKISGTTTNGSVTVTNSNDYINLRTSNGSVTARNCSGEITLRTSNGRMNISDLNGVISATTSNGSVDMSNISGVISATTSNAAVTLSNITGHLKIGTSNGAVRLDDVSGSVDARTSNGSMTVTMKSASDYVKLSTSRGNVSLTLPADRGYDLNVRADNISTSGMRNFRGTTERRSLNGTMANGGARIDVSASGGRANLSFN